MEFYVIIQKNIGIFCYIEKKVVTLQPKKQ